MTLSITLYVCTPSRSRNSTLQNHSPLQMSSWSQIPLLSEVTEILIFWVLLPWFYFKFIGQLGIGCVWFEIPWDIQVNVWVLKCVLTPLAGLWMWSIFHMLQGLLEAGRRDTHDNNTYTLKKLFKEDGKSFRTCGKNVLFALLFPLLHLTTFEGLNIKFIFIHISRKITCNNFIDLCGYRT